MDLSDARLAQLIGSRICHDLISPIGAINNGLELMGMAPSTRDASPEMELVTDSLGNATARIRFFRIAFGAAGEEPLGQAEITGILRDLAPGSRVTFRWEPTECLPRTEVRLAFLAMQCMESALPFGGEVRIRRDSGQWELIGEGRKTSIDRSLWAAFDVGGALPQELRAAEVHFALLAIEAAETAIPITVEEANGRVRMTLR